jgi:hypothetical protein
VKAQLTQPYSTGMCTAIWNVQKCDQGHTPGTDTAVDIVGQHMQHMTSSLQYKEKGLGTLAGTQHMRAYLGLDCKRVSSHLGPTVSSPSATEGLLGPFIL